MEKRETQTHLNKDGQQLGPVGKKKNYGFVSPCKDPFVVVEDYLNLEVEEDIFGELLKPN